MVESDSSAACPACGATLPLTELDVHLLQTHRSYAFRGVLRTISEAQAVLASAVCSRNPDALAWRALETIATHERGERVDEFLAQKLTQSVERLSAHERKRTLPAVATLITTQGICPNLVLQQLATSANPAGRHLAWAMIDRAPNLLTSDVLEGLLAGQRTQPALEQ